MLFAHSGLRYAYHLPLTDGPFGSWPKGLTLCHRKRYVKFKH